MKKWKIVKFLFPLTYLLGVSISFPFILSSCSEEQKPSTENNTQILEQELEKKRKENDNILKSLKWTYDTQQPNALYKVVGNICNYKDKTIDIKNGASALGVYPIVQVDSNSTGIYPGNGTGTYCPITQWFTPITTSTLKGKVFSLESIKANFVPSIDENTNETYSITIEGLALSDATADYPEGDWRTMAKFIEPIEIIKISGPTKNSITTILTKYSQLAEKTDQQETNKDKLRDKVNIFLEALAQVTQDNPGQVPPVDSPTNGSQQQTSRAISDVTTKTPLKGLDTMFKEGLEQLTGESINKIINEVKTSQSLSTFEIVTKTLDTLFNETNSVLVKNSKEMYNQIAQIKQTSYPTSSQNYGSLITTSTFANFNRSIRYGVNFDDLINMLPTQMRIHWFADMVKQLLDLSFETFYTPFYNDLFNAIKPVIS